MSADRLLAYYEHVADAPDAIPRMRRFILDLAVRGNLVPQDPTNEPVSELLKWRITQPLIEPFVLPPTWAWARVGTVAEARLGKMLDKAKNKGTPRPYLRNVNVRWFDFDLSDVLEMRFEDSELPEFELRSGDVLICEGGEPGRAAVWDGREPDIYFQKAIHRVRFSEVVDPKYFVKALRASADDGRLAEYFTGTGIKHFTGKGLDAYLFPLPPVAEQRRIVAKVDELMELCDRLEAARKEGETTRDRLTVASLAHLNTPDPDPEIFKSHAHFALNNVAGLTARPEQIKQLRETILSLAVRGQLVPQDCNERPASELLTRIQAERTRQLQSTLNGQRSLQSAEIRAPYAVPNSWLWVRVEDCFNVGGGIQKTPARTPRVNAHPYIGVGNVYRGRLDLSKVKQFELVTGDLDKFRLVKGDLLVVEGNGSENEIGRCAMWSGEIESCVHQNHIIRCRPFIAEMSPFVLRFLNSTHGVQVMKTLAVTSSGLYNLSVGRVRTIIIPLPPFAEQCRIVAKVDELMALCDRLEASLVSGEDHRRRLLGALLAEALAPVEEIQAV